MKVFKFENLLNIDEPTIIKPKNKPRESQNKKNIITKIYKTIIRFTKRNFSNFKIVKTKIKIKVKRVKKSERNTTTNTTNTITQNKKQNITNITTRNKQNTTTRTRQNVRTFKITRATTSISQIINIFNNKTNDNNFNNFDTSSNNEKFRISKNENEIINND